MFGDYESLLTKKKVHEIIYKSFYIILLSWRQRIQYPILMIILILASLHLPKSASQEFII